MSSPKAKTKAKELFKKYSKGKDEHGWALCEFDSCAKQCALIAVKETILALKQARQWTEYLSSAFADIDNDMNYWINVHKELEKL
jgi:hypothetical protein